MKGLFRDRLALLGLMVVVLTILTALLPGLFTVNDPLKVDLVLKLRPPGADFPLGTDPLGRCLISRLLVGAGNTIKAGIVVLALAVLAGTTVGGIAGMAGGAVDRFLMRLVDALLAFPAIVLAVVAAGLLGPSFGNLVLALAAVAWVSYARIVRGMVLEVKNRDFVLAAVCTGTNTCGLLIRHIFPNIAPQIAVVASSDLGSIILNISGLSFLGLGIQPPSPELGVMIRDYWAYILTYPHLVLYPGGLLASIIFAFNALGDGLRGLWDIREVREK